MNEGQSLEAYYGDMPDPRVVGRCDVCGAEGWEDIEEFGQNKESWLRPFLELPCGIPSHDTFRRMFSLLVASAFQERFARWVEGVFTVKRGQVITFDGKTLRGSQDERNGKNALHLVSVWASASGFFWGQRKVAEQSNEITAG